MSDDILNDINVALSNLSYVFYKEIKIIKKMILMKAKDIEEIYPEVKDYEIEQPKDPILPDKDKYAIKCLYCEDGYSKSTGIIVIDGNINKYEFYHDKDDCRHKEYVSITDDRVCAVSHKIHNKEEVK